MDARLAEDLARVHVGRSDDRGALPFLEARLALGTPSQELWLMRADIAARLGDWEREADSIEHAMALGGVSLDRRGALIRLYIEHQQPAKALIQVRSVSETLPPDRAIREQYARFLDELQPDAALAAWKRTLDADPRSELAHYRITQILTEQNPNEALQAVEAGIAAVPDSARLYLAKSQILEKLNQYYPARATLRQAAARLPQMDAPFLARLAEMEDAGGVDAARYYQQLVEVLEKTSAASTERSTALQHGLDAALRDADMERVKWFQARLLGSPTAGDGPLVQTRGGSVLIPGGLAALSFMSRSRPAPPDRFLVDYARTVARNAGGTDKKVADAYISNIREYFRRLNELAALGVRQGDHVTVTLDLKDRNGQRNAEKILDLLGWRMESTREGVKLNPIEKGSKAARQETASALAINEIGMKENLESGKPFSFDIHYEAAAALLGEEAWRTQFYANENYPGGLAEAIVNDLELAQIYAGLGQMDGATAAALISGTPLKGLADQSAEQLFRYSSAMAVDRGRVVVPGGSAAAPLWSNLARVSPDQPAPFFRALLAKDGGELLAFYGAVSALDLPHQRFFTRTPERLNNFYELFRDAPETRRSPSRRIQAGPFAEFLAEVPLDRDGNLDFPGSPEVWMVAKGQSDDVAKMLKQVKRAAAPEVEDQILLRLAGTRYKKAGVVQGELDNFLAVVRIDSHRAQPLDQASALYLAQHFDDDEAVYPYFAALTGLKEKQFQEFFELSDAMRSLEGLEKNAALGTFHSLVKILCLAQQAGALDETQAAELFGKIVERFQRVNSPATRAIASVELVREIMAQAVKNPTGDPDSAMRQMLLGSYAPVDVTINGAIMTVDSSKTRHTQFQQVLEMQKVPSLATVFAVFDALQELAAGKGSASGLVQTIESKSAGLFRVEVPKAMHPNGQERDMIEGFDPKRLQEIVKDLRTKIAKKKVNPKDLAKLAQDYLAEINGPVRWALEGIVYACFLSPEDLLVSEDPLLLRKHRFGNLAPDPKQKMLLHERSDVNQSSEGIGSYFTGGFASFEDAAGKAAAQSAKLGGEYGEAIASKQMAALRSIDWGNLHDDDLRVSGLKVTVAREWIGRAASQPELDASLAEATLGLLSLTRRANLIAALGDRDWGTVWSCVTLSDLYFLGDRYLAQYAADPWQSPATRALRAAHPNAAKLGLERATPYEDREKELLPDKIAERSAEFNLYLVRYADGAGIPAAALGALAEPAARVLLKRMQLADIYDWRSELAAYSELDGKVLQEALASAKK